MTKEFEEGLKQIDMLSPNKEEVTGLVLSYEDCKNEYERAIWEEVRVRYHGDGVYFRRYPNLMPSIPQIIIYDTSNRRLDEGDIAQFHKKIWNSGIVPLAYVFTKTEIIIFNTNRTPFDKTGKLQYSVFDKILLGEEIEENLEKKRNFSAKLFDNGFFLEQGQYKDSFNVRNSSYESLLIALKQVRQNILRLPVFKNHHQIAHKLLVMSILLKYLEERKDEEGNNVLGKSFFERFQGASCLIDVFNKKGACLELFDYLSNKDQYNGSVFKWDNNEERAILSNIDLTDFSYFLSGHLDKNSQLSIWEQYDFNYIPIELISNIYEEFLGKIQGVVYTPPFLVSMLINECMPLTKEAALKFKKNNYCYKILDPACGSGVFLVMAYIRLIQWWRICNDYKRPTKDVLKEILRKNIYGIDKDANAVQLTYFSLCLSLCDLLSPKDIYPDNLHFDDLLGKNFISNDFFELEALNKVPDDFCLIVGNPPFGSFNSGELKSEYAIQIESQLTRAKVREAIPQNEISLLFADRAMHHIQEEGLLCMILPSANTLYYQNSYRFRQYLSNNYNIPQIIDFTHIARVLFKANTGTKEKGADVATLALFVEKKAPTNDRTLHLVIKRTKAVKEKIYFEIDKYDFHWVPKSRIGGKCPSDRLIWKANYLGGGRIIHLLSRLQQVSFTFGDLLESKQKESDWIVGEGIKIGNSKRNKEKYQNETDRLAILQAKELLDASEKIELSKLERKYARADFLFGKEYIDSGKLRANGIVSGEKETLSYKYYYKDWVSKPLLFEPPLLLIRETIDGDKLPMDFIDHGVAYSSQIIGIHSPQVDSIQLKNIFKNLSRYSRLYSFYLLATSGRTLIAKANSILMGDIKNLPYFDKEFSLCETEEAIVSDVLNYASDFRSQGEKSRVVLPVVEEDVLFDFGYVYTKLLNSAYSNLKAGKPKVFETFIIYPFYFGDVLELGEDTVALNDLLKRLLQKEDQSSNLRINRILRLYDDNAIYMIKPNQLRYWLKSVAIIDADETFCYLSKNGL